MEVLKDRILYSFEGSPGPGGFAVGKLRARDGAALGRDRLAGGGLAA